jgi:Helix-turn-helix domain
MTTIEERFLNIKQLAARWNVTTKTVRNRRAEGVLKSLRIGRIILFRIEDIRAYEEAQMEKLEVA